MSKINLPQITVVVADCLNPGAAISAIRKTQQHITPNRIILFTDTDIKVTGVETIVIERINSKNQYSHFIMKELWKYINTDFVLVIQHDGHPICKEAWDDRFLDYDFLGSPWNYPDSERCVGNGGCSIRSKRLLEVLGTDDFITVTEQEDDAIARLYGAYLEEKHGIKFAPVELAEKFGFELREPWQPTFAYHGNFFAPFKPHVVIQRNSSMGDILMCEPVLSYFNDKGYQVVLDCRVEFFALFFNSTYPIKHISEMNPKIKPEKVISLDMSYESKPKEPVLKTYYEFAGIKDGIMRNSKLNVWQQPNQRFFDKVIFIHICETGMPYRSQFGINWNYVVSYYQKLGYLVFQLGKRIKELVAPHFNTDTIPMLLYAIKGADLVIGLDSGISQIAVALNVPTVIMSGSVDLSLRYSDFSNIEVVQKECPDKTLKHCYHSQEGSVTGVDCRFNKEQPVCCTYSEYDILAAANKLLGNKKSLVV